MRLWHLAAAVATLAGLVFGYLAWVALTDPDADRVSLRTGCFILLVVSAAAAQDLRRRRP